MKNIIMIVICSTLAWSCNKRKIEDINNLSSSINITVPTKEVGELNFIENAEFIFLDKEYLIGKIGRLLVHNNNIYIHDELTEKIVVYTLKGKFLFAIESQGKGPNEYLKITDFTIDRLNNNILIMDANLHKVLTYSISKKDFIDVKGFIFHPTAFAWHNNKMFFFNPYTFNYAQDDKYRYSLIVTTANYKNEEKFFKVSENMGNFRSNPNRKGFFYGDNLYFLNRFEFVIYSLTDDFVKKHCDIQFANNDDYLPALNDAIKRGTRNTERYKNCAKDIRNYCENCDFITFEYSKADKLYSLIFSKKINKVIYHSSNSKITTPSLLKKNIPIFKFPEYIYDNSFISIIPFAYINHITKDKKSIKLIEENLEDKKILNGFEDYDINCNPVLAIYHFNE